MTPKPPCCPTNSPQTCSETHSHLLPTKPILHFVAKTTIPCPPPKTTAWITCANPACQKQIIIQQSKLKSDDPDQLCQECSTNKAFEDLAAKLKVAEEKSKESVAKVKTLEAIIKDLEDRLAGAEAEAAVKNAAAAGKRR